MCTCMYKCESFYMLNCVYVCVTAYGCVPMYECVHVALFGFHTQYGFFYRNIPVLSRNSSESSPWNHRNLGQGSWEMAEVPQSYLNST